MGDSQLQRWKRTLICVPTKSLLKSGKCIKQPHAMQYVCSPCSNLQRYVQWNTVILYTLFWLSISSSCIWRWTSTEHPAWLVPWCACLLPCGCSRDRLSSWGWDCPVSPTPVLFLSAHGCRRLKILFHTVLIPDGDELMALIWKPCSLSLGMQIKMQWQELALSENYIFFYFTFLLMSTLSFSIFSGTTVSILRRWNEKRGFHNIFKL